MSIRLEQVGYCGKAPHRGDFIHRDMPSRFRRAYEEIIASGVATARRDMGGAFDAHYNVMPLWRFAIRPGVIDPYGAIGVLGPSVDSVGRMFPFTVMAVTRQTFEPVSALNGGRDFLYRCEDVVLTALDPRADLERAVEGLHRITDVQAREESVPLSPNFARQSLKVDPEGGVVRPETLSLDDPEPFSSAWATIGGEDCPPEGFGACGQVVSGEIIPLLFGQHMKEAN